MDRYVFFFIHHFLWNELSWISFPCGRSHFGALWEFFNKYEINKKLIRINEPHEVEYRLTSCKSTNSDRNTWASLYVIMTSSMTCRLSWRWFGFCLLQWYPREKLYRAVECKLLRGVPKAVQSPHPFNILLYIINFHALTTCWRHSSIFFQHRSRCTSTATPEYLVRTPIQPALEGVSSSAQEAFVMAFVRKAMHRCPTIFAGPVLLYARPQDIIVYRGVTQTFACTNCMTAGITAIIQFLFRTGLATLPLL